MRIVLLSHTNTPWAPLYARGFLERGHAVRVLSFHPDEIEGVETHFLGIEPFDKYRNKHVYLTRLAAVRRLTREFEADVLFAPYLTSNGWMAAAASPVPFLASARGGDVLPHSDHAAALRLVRSALLRFVCRRAQAVHVVAPHLGSALGALGVPPAKITCFPMGVDLEAFRPATGPARPASLVCTRSHMPVYDIPTLLEALALLAERGRDFHCELVGGGNLLESHRAWVRDRGLDDRIDLLGPMPHVEVARAMRRARVYVTPATSDGASSSLLEAMATGLVPIATDIEANRPWIEPGRNGLLFPPRDARQLCDRLELALDDDALAARARDQNPHRIETEASLARNLERTISLLEDCARAGAR